MNSKKSVSDFKGFLTEDVNNILKYIEEITQDNLKEFKHFSESFQLSEIEIPIIEAHDFDNDGNSSKTEAILTKAPSVNFKKRIPLIKYKKAALKRKIKEKQMEVKKFVQTEITNFADNILSFSLKGIRSSFKTIRK